MLDVINAEQSNIELLDSMKGIVNILVIIFITIIVFFIVYEITRKFRRKHRIKKTGIKIRKENKERQSIRNKQNT